MRNLSKPARIMIYMAILFVLNGSVSFAGTYEFDPSGESQNSFNPRGYMLDTGTKRARWISSPFDNSGSMPKYIGTANGLDYVDVKKAGTLYALTDRNPTPGKQYLYGAKDGREISGFSSRIGAPAKADIATTGRSTGWKIPIDMDWEAGCRYEFAFLRGMRANNGITLVFSEDGRGYLTNPITAEERAWYDQHRFEEYQFIVSYEKDKDPETNENHYFNFYMVPMRFTIQTYADMAVWEKAAGRAESFLDSVTERQLKEGRYKRSNIKALRRLLESLNEKTEKTVRKQLQPRANQMMEDMVRELEAMVEKAKSEKPEPADISKLTAALKEAKALYKKASANMGQEKGQYGETETRNLGDEIAAAEEMDKFTPQDEIDVETEALESAMLEVKKSLRLEEAMYFYDKATGIYIIAPGGSLPEDAKLFVRRMGTRTQAYQAMMRNLSEEGTEAIFYDIQFYQAEYQIQPTQQVEVQMPIDSSMSVRSSRIYAVGKTGKLKEVKSVAAGGTRIFQSQRLGHLVLAGSMATDAEKAQARSQRLQKLMAQTEDSRGDNKEQELQKTARKKEVFVEPLNAMMKRQASAADFSDEVRRETDPVYLIIVAGILAAAAVAMALRRMWELKLKGRKLR